MKTKQGMNHATKWGTIFNPSVLLSIYVIVIIFLIFVQSIIFKPKQYKANAMNHENSYLTVHVFMIGSIGDKFMAYVTEPSTSAMPRKLLLQIGRPRQ